jgi:hypothetical protein|tara:strand:- start:6 stop:728 length:723 start_codon:yes stop_codon:yes gene_type:complete
MEKIMAISTGVKKKSHEKLDNANVLQVKELLDAENPISKKEACDMLNIRYNTTRLQRIIDEFTDVWEHKEKRRSQNRGKGATRDEIKSVIEYYLEGDNISEISTRLYRSNAFVKAIIDRVGIPQKLPSGYSRTKDIMLPEQCVSDEFRIGEKVWSARDNGIAEIKAEHTTAHQDSKPGLGRVDYEAKYGAKGYQLFVQTPCDTSKTLFPWLDGTKMGHYSFALSYDLGSLRHLEQYGVNL